MQRTCTFKEKHKTAKSNWTALTNSQMGWVVRSSFQGGFRRIWRSSENEDSWKEWSNGGESAPDRHRIPSTQTKHRQQASCCSRHILHPVRLFRFIRSGRVRTYSERPKVKGKKAETNPMDLIASFGILLVVKGRQGRLKSDRRVVATTKK